MYCELISTVVFGLLSSKWFWLETMGLWTLAASSCRKLLPFLHHRPLCSPSRALSYGTLYRTFLPPFLSQIPTEEKESKKFVSQGKDLYYLLFSWLEEIPFILITEGFAIKRIEFDIEARDGIKRGVDALANAVKVTLGPKGRNVIIGKSFGATRALNDVSFEFNPGEIFALVGANGAGKSTLIKIICGYYSDYEGQILVEGKEVNFSSPHDAYSNGIQTVHQIINQSVVQNMTVAENLALEELLSSEQSFFYKRQAIKDRAITIAEKMDLHFPDLDMPVGLLSQSERQMIAIARALASEPKLLILDEPTSSISDKETERLFAILVQLRKMGVAILYVSHRLHEIERIADRVGVVRDGAQGETLERPFDVKRIVTAMVGEIKKHKVLDSGTEKKYPKVKLELRNYVIEEGGSPINLKVYEGEILGITGLIGAGKSELALAMFGVTTPFSGEMFIDGQLVKPKTIAEAIQKGVFLVPEDRNNNAVIPEFTIQQNITLPFLQSFSKFGFFKSCKRAAVRKADG